MPTAIYDIFRYIKLYSPDGSTLEQRLEADNVNDSLTIRRGDGVSWNVPTVNPGATITVTVGFDTGGGLAMGAYYLDGVEQKPLTLARGSTYTFDQSDATNSSYGGYLSPLVFSNTADGAVSGAISGEEYTTGVTYLLDDVSVTKANYKLGFTGATTRQVKLELNDSAPTTFYYGSHDNVGQGGTITTTAGDDIMMIDVNYSLDVPPGTTKIELTDVNAATTHVELSASGGIQLTRKNANEIEIGSFAVAEIDTLHTVTKRNAITTNQLYIQDIEVGNITSSTTEDGFTSPSAEFLGTGTVGDALRLAITEREITSNTVTKTFTFNSKPSKGVLQYTVGYQLDSGTAATAVSASIQRFNGVTWTTLDTVSGVAGVPYEFSNLYNEADNSGGQYRVVYTISGNTGTITLELQAYYEIIEITDNPVLRTESGTGTVRTRDLAPLGVNDIGRGSEPYDNVYANTFHGHLQGTFDGEITGSVFADDSTQLVDAVNGYLTADVNVGSNPFTVTSSQFNTASTTGTVNINSQSNINISVLAGGNLNSTVTNGNMNLDVTSGNINVTAGAGDILIDADAGKITLESNTGIDPKAPFINNPIFAYAGFVGDLKGSVFAVDDSTTVIDGNTGTVIGEVNNSQVTTANAEIGTFTDTVGTITAGNITGFKMMSDAYGTDGTSKLVDATANQIVGEVNANTNKTGALTIVSDTSIAFNSGVGVDVNGKLVNSANAAQPFAIASPVTLEKELRSSPGAQEKMLYTNVSTGVYEIDTTDTQNVYWNAPSGSLVANFTGLETSTQRVRRVRIHILQGNTFAYIPTVQINGVVQGATDLGIVSSEINKLNIYEFTFYRTHTNTWAVYQQQVDGTVADLVTPVVLENPNAGHTDLLTFKKENNLYGGLSTDVSLTRKQIILSAQEDFVLRADGGSLRLSANATGTAVTGDLSVSGDLTASGAFIGSRQTISGPGVINLTTLHTEITTTGADAYTLANGTLGQMKIISMVVDGGDATVTPTTLANGTTITFDAVHGSVTMIYGTNGWLPIAFQDAVIA